MKKLTIPTFIFLFISIAILNIDRNKFTSDAFNSDSTNIELSDQTIDESQFELLAEENEDESKAFNVDERSLILYSIDVFQLVLKQ